MDSSRFDLENQVRRPRISVVFKINDKEIDISDSFSIIFISEGKPNLALIKGSHIRLPKLPKDIEFVSVVFKHGKHELFFPKVGLDLIEYRGKIDWVFRIVYPPFNDMRITEIEQNKPSKICYFGFSPEKGTGIEVIAPVYD